MKKLKILAVFSIILLFTACASQKGSSNQNKSSSATNDGGTKSELVYLTGSFIHDKEFPWTQSELMVKQYFLDGEIMLSWVETVKGQWTDANGGSHMRLKRKPKAYVIKDHTRLTLDTIVGKTFWFKYSYKGTFRYISFMRYPDDKFYFTPGAMTVNLDGVQCTYQPTSLAAKIKLNVDKDEGTDKIEKSVAEGSSIGGGSESEGEDLNAAPAGFGSDPYADPYAPANNQQQNQQPQRQTQPAQQQSKPAPSGKQPLLPDGM